MVTPSSPWMARNETAALRGVGPWLAGVGGLIALGLSGTFVARRLAGEFGRSLSGSELLLLTLLLVGVLAGLRCMRPGRPVAFGERRGEFLAQAIPTAAAVMLALAVTSPQSPLWAVVLLWVSLSVEETWRWGHTPRGTRPPRRASGSQTWGDAIRRNWLAEGSEGVSATPPQSFAVEEAMNGERNDALLEEGAEDDALPPEHLQQLTRFRDEDGGEVIHGRLRAKFATNQRVHYLHIAFCPPLAVTPELVCEQIEGADASLATGQVETYGARIDLRLARPAAEGESVVVEFYARAAS